MATTFADLDGNGVASRAFAFPSIKEADIKVEVDGTLYENRGITGASSGATTFTITSYTTTGGGNVVFDSAPATSANKIRIFRDTDVDSPKATFTAGASIKANELNNVTQLLYAAQEEQNQTVITSDIKDLAITTAKIAPDAVTGAKIADDQINSEHYVDGSIDHVHLANDIIDGDNIQNDVINSEHYVAGSIDHEHLANDIIDGDNIQDDVINSEHYVAGSIDHEHLANDIIDGDNIQDDVINSEHYVHGSIDTIHIADSQVTTAKIANANITAAKIGNAAVTTDKIADVNVTTPKLGDSSVTTAKIAADAVDGTKIANDSINSEHYVDGSIDTAHIADSQITTAKIGDDQITTGKIGANQVTNAKLAANSVDSANYVDGSIDTVHIGNDQVTAGKLATNSVTTLKILDANVTTPKIADLAVTTAKIANDNVTTGKIGASQVTTAKIADSNVTTAKIADLNVTNAKLSANSVDSVNYVDGSIDTVHIGGAQVTDAKLASNAVTTNKITDANVTTIKIADSNVTLAKLASDLKQTTISDSDTQLPTSGAVVDYVAAQIAPIGGLEVIATEVAFPNTQPSSGVVISIADAGGVVVNGSGVSTTGRTVGSSTVTINGFPSSLQSKTMAAGVGLMVSSTGSGQVYNYHKLLAKEADVEQLSNDINDFAARYRVGSTNPTSDLDAGDLFFNTGTSKLLVYNATNSAWEEAQSIGNYFINTISSYSGTGGNSATFNGSAYRFVLSDPGTVAEQHIVSVNGVVQKPNSGTSQPSEGFAIDGSSIIFSSAPSSGADFFIITIGSTVNIGTPSNGTVSTAKLASDAVTTAKIADSAVTTAKIADGAIVNADVNASAAIAGTKIAPDFGSQNIVTTGTLGSENITVTGTSPTINFTDSNSNPDFRIHRSGSGLSIQDTTNSNATRFLVKTNGDIDITGNLDAQGGVDVTGNVAATGNVTAVNITASNDITAKDMVISDTTPSLSFTDTDNNPDFKIMANSGALQFIDTTNSNTNRLVINSDGHVDVTGNLDVGAGIDCTGTVAATSFTGDGSSLSGINTDLVSDTSPQLGGDLNTNGNIIKFPDATGVDVNRCKFGTGNDLHIYHNASDSMIRHEGTGHLVLQSTTGDIRMHNGNENMFVATRNGAVELYHDNSKKFETTSAGVTVTGDITAPDNGVIRLGSATSGDLKIFHDGSQSYIDNQTGTLRIRIAGAADLIAIEQDRDVWIKGHPKPWDNNTYDLGSSSYRWRNIYTNDLNLSNKGSSNDVDGTWGDWTIQEGESDLFLKNNRSGKKYKFNLTEVS